LPIPVTKFLSLNNIFDFLSFENKNNKDVKSTTYLNTISFTTLNKNCFLISPDIYGELVTEKVDGSKSSYDKNIYVQINLIIRSKKSMIEIQKFINNINNEYYNNLINTQNYSNLLLMYNGYKINDVSYSRSAIKTYNEYVVDKTQTFDNLFFNHKYKLIDMCNK
jgi:hypothetical protein